MTPVRAVLFDAYGTLLDVHGVAAVADELAPGRGAELSALWRAKQLEYAGLVTLAEDGARYRPFTEVTRAALRYAVRRLGLSLGTDDEARLVAAYDRLPVVPDAADVLRTLRGRGLPTGVLSNGDPPMLAAALRAAGLDGLLDHVLSVDAVRRYKTHPDAYALGPRAVGAPADAIAFVSANAWDALAATWYGYRTVWIDRAGAPFETLGTEPWATAASLRDVLSLV